MSKLQELIDRLCPNGVDFKPLGEVCEFQRGDTLSSKDAIEGDVPVMAGGQKPSCYHNVANRSGETIVVAGSGAYAGFVTYWNIPVFVSDAFTVNPSNCMLPKYVFYFLKNNQEKIHATKKGAGVPHVHGKDIAKFLIPVPPIEVQEEIVKILDRFADYAAELQAELQARKEQYEYYRNLLLTFNPSAYGCGTDGEQEINVTTWGGHSYEIQWKTMGEIASFKYGFTAKGCDKGDARYIRITDISELGSLLPYDKKYIILNDESVEYLLNKDDIVMARTGATFGKTLLYEEDIPAVYASFLIKISFKNNDVLNKYYWHFTKSKHYWKQANKFVSKGGQPQFNANSLSQIVIPIPPLELQEKIVAILDRFETLVNDLSKGLPAEIEAVKARYEYYRNKLLTFNPLSA